ncbi:MAG: aldo/keto reductase [Candidatus Nitrosotenuis sp.]
MTVEQYALAHNLSICRILNGMWQVSGAHGKINPKSAIDDMVGYNAAGLTSWDMADIYGPAEEIFGAFRQKIKSELGDEESAKITALTKFVPHPTTMSYSFVEHSIAKSLSRMRVPIIDAVQFHWWDYENPNYLDAMRHLSDMRDRGKIRHVALTNFDTQRMQEMVDHGFGFVSNQVQYSIIDQRPSVKMERFCKQNKIRILAYGVLCGGFISEKYIGRPEPRIQSLDTASLQKYKNMIDMWGGWDLFQKLLLILDKIAKKHGVSIANVAMRYILDKPQVAGIIIGARLGISSNYLDNLNVFRLRLDSDDRAQINDFSLQSNNLFSMIGDCGDEYR